MQQSFLTRALLLVGAAIILVVLLNLYLVEPRLALQLESPETLPGIAQISSPPPAKQVATTMDLIKKMAAAKPHEKEVFVPRQVLRNPFLDSRVKVETREIDEIDEMDEHLEEEDPYLAQVQMVLIGEYQKSALLDGTLVAEGDIFRTFRVISITEAEVSLQRFEEVVILPLGAYNTASLSPLGGKRKTQPKREISVPVKQKETINELLQRLEPLLARDEENAKSEK